VYPPAHRARSPKKSSRKVPQPRRHYED
jgi:hypothetical protein